MNKKMKKGFALVGRKGFTLIELLVVIAIIGILAALIITSLSGARLRASDTQTKNNVRSLSTALEQYYSDQTTGAYPTSASQVAFNNAALTTPLGPYVSGSSTSQVFTGYTTGSNGYITNAGGSGYLAAAGLRNTTEQGTNDPNSLSCAGSTGSGNGEYLTSSTAGQLKMCVGTSLLTLTGLKDGLGNTATTGTRTWVVYGPQ